MSVQTSIREPSPAPRNPPEALEIENETTEESILYPSGVKLWMTVFSILLSVVFVGLDMTIVAVAVPSLSDHFKRLDDIGWYSATYQLVYSCFIFFFARLYTVFSVKHVFLGSLCLFELGSLLCTVAPTSATFILGRAIAGFGSGGIQSGGIICLTYCFPVQKRPFWTSIIGAAGNISLVIAPLIGGVLIDSLSWRACFGINLPIGALTIALTAYGMNNPNKNTDANLLLWEKLKRLDLASTLVFAPAIVSLLIALQWGGIKYGWGNVKIILLFVLFAVLIGAFVFIQYRRKEDATLPPRIMRQKSIIAAACFNACCNGILAVTEYYMSIYFQGVKGFTATKSGALGLSIFAGLIATGLAAGIGTTVLGYYWPFMLAGSVLTPIASGLITTIHVDENIVKVLFLLAFLGAAVGLGIPGPTMAVQTILPQKDIATGVAITAFAGTLASSLFVSVSATLFQARLYVELEHDAPGTNTTIFDIGGLSDVRQQIGPAKLKNVLRGYDAAVVQTLYIPVALAALSFLASAAMERRSVKKTQ